ncbi:hypothetical protein ARMGADRAFT_551496 [Armillaria gallica]|uniref:Uncharacterized protein n=1 Tax=Armillaria gallica TaxID=47427 RepID=A0A2H3CV47_ARMGA|nr:hypothetical protein ARMGADRAFT_551496 [Armillaria gallica]
MLERWELTMSLKSLVVSRIPSHIKGVLNATALGLLETLTICLCLMYMSWFRRHWLDIATGMAASTCKVYIPSVLCFVPYF